MEKYQNDTDNYLSVQYIKIKFIFSQLYLINTIFQYAYELLW